MYFLHYRLGSIKEKSIDLHYFAMNFSLLAFSVVPSTALRNFPVRKNPEHNKPETRNNPEHIHKSRNPETRD
jgi:hypothetical protein